MPRKSTGSVRWVEATAKTPAHFAARITCPADGSRPWVHLKPIIQSEKLALEKAAEWSREAKERGLTAADFGLRTKQRAKPAPTTPANEMQKWVNTWVEQRTKRGLSSAGEAGATYTKHVVPVMGTKHVREWSPEDLRSLCRALDAKVQRASSDDEKIRKSAITWKTARNCWGVITKLCKESCRSKHEELRVRDDNPARDVDGPDRGGHKAKQYLYPSEVLAVLAREEIPVSWRRLFAISVFTYARPEEMEPLEWSDVDLVHGTIRIHRAIDRFRNPGKIKTTKTGHVRTIPVEPALLPLLKAMHKEVGGEGRVIRQMPPPGQLPRKLRDYLGDAGVTRDVFKSDATRMRINWYHATRSTGITWAAVRGDDALKIMSRAGHEDFKTTQIYIRSAENFAVNFGEPFPPLPTSLLGNEQAVLENEQPSSACEIDPARPLKLEQSVLDFEQSPIVFLAVQSSTAIVQKQKHPKNMGNWVGAAGFEPATSSV